MNRTDIVNADTPIVIEVSEQATKSQRRKNPGHCAFAEACNQMPHVEEAIIHLSTAYLKFKGEKKFRRYRVNTRLRDQIVIFDKYGDFEPGDYTLATISESHKASGKRQGSAGTGLKPGDKRKRVMIEGVRGRANISAL
jgi:hypothetical protein